MFRARDEVIELETLAPLPFDEIDRARRSSAWIVVAAAVLIGAAFGSTATYVLVGRTSPTRHTAVVTRLDAFQAIAGAWKQHSTELTISKNGEATFQSRRAHGTVTLHAGEGRRFAIL